MDNVHAIPTTATTHRTRALHIGLWVAQGLLAAAFLAAGLMKATTPLAELAAQMPWVKGPMGGMVRFIGAAEIAGALGLVLPAATRIKPLLTPLAALGLATVMVLAVFTHVAYGEMAHLAAPAALGAMAAFVAWGRWRKVPVAPRS